MRSAAAAIAWEFWSANRRGWLLVLAAIPACALLYRALAGPLQNSDGMRSLSFLPMVMSLILAAAFCNFTDRNRRDGIAGFPRHFFSMPVSTRLVVTCAMACGLASVVGLYIAWAMFVFQPLDIVLSVRWPAMLIAAGVVFYQAIIWCLCGFRLARIISLSLVATVLVGIGFLPTLRPTTDVWTTESTLSTILAALMAIAYAATLVTVDVQRRGGARGWAWIHTLIDSLVRVIPQRRNALKTADAALFWIEWRRAGLVLPAAVIVTMSLILSSLLWLTKRGPEATLWAETWLFVTPMLLAFPVGMGFGKPDFWTLDLSLSPFVAARPVTGGQLLAAKMKAAAWSTFIAWAAVLLVAPMCIYAWCDTAHWGEAWRMSTLIYSPFWQVAVPILALVVAVLVTWSIMVGCIWLGCSGRPWFYYTFVSAGMAVFLAMLIYFVWWQDHPHQRGNIFVSILPWLPWALAAGITAKTWTAVVCTQRLLRRGLISNRNVAVYLSIWLAAAFSLVLFGWALSQRVEWLRDTLMLVGLCAVPAVRLAATPLAIAWNRHR